MGFSPANRKRLIAGCALVIGLLAFKYLFPILLPFLLGLAVASLLSPVILWLQNRFRLRHGTASALAVLVLFLLLGGILYGLGKLLLISASRLYRYLPELLSGISSASAAFAERIERFSRLLPGSAGDAFRNWSDNLVSLSGTLAGTLYEKFFTLISEFLGKLPNFLLMVLTTLLACFFSAGELPKIKEQLLCHLPKNTKNRAHRLLVSVKSVIGSYFRAQLQLFGITFLILTGGMLFLSEDSPLLFSLGISLLDALPLFGTGAVLIPWGLGRILLGQTVKGIGLLLLYVIAALTRNALEPRLLGRQMGISPLLTLIAIYTGYRFSGFGGMLLFPIFLMVGAELYRLSRSQIPEYVQSEPSHGFYFPHTENSGG